MKEMVVITEKYRSVKRLYKYKGGISSENGINNVLWILCISDEHYIAARTFIIFRDFI